MRLAKIGVWHGVTTRVLRQVMAPDWDFFAIDPYPVGQLRFSTQRIIAHCGVNRLRTGRVRWLRKTGAEAAKDPTVTAATIDFLFIDGDHSYDGLKGDWEGWNGLMAPGGVVLFARQPPHPDSPNPRCRQC